MPSDNALRCLLPAAFRSSQATDRISPAADSVYLPTEAADVRVTPLAYRKYSYR